MAHKERINPKTNRKEYKVRYYFMFEGKRRDSETAWFPSLELAEKEAKKLKEEKEKADANLAIQRRDKKFGTAFSEFIEDLRDYAEKNNSNSYRAYVKNAVSTYNMHLPEYIANVRVKEITPSVFKEWMNYMNKKDVIGGLYMANIRTIVLKFNNWLSDNGYYVDNDLDLLIETAIKRVKLKSLRKNNKEDAGLRNQVSFLDLEKIAEYYKDKGLGKFRNFYFYTLFYVLFYSGMRVEEITGLQWKFVDLRPTHRTISIKNVISQLEPTEKANERVSNELYRTKNRTSLRTIPIFDFYYELLIDYKESFKYEYAVSDKELEECFVFPNLSLQSGRSPHNYQKAYNLRLELNKATSAVGLPKTDNQMFRHSCATFLILPPPDGLGYTEEKVIDYFGHTDTAMLKKVYARLNTIQKADRMRHTFSEIYKPSSGIDRTAEEENKLKMIKRITGDNEEESFAARKDRIFKQISSAVKRGQAVYYFMEKDRKIIEEASKIYRIEFICS